MASKFPIPRNGFPASPKAFDMPEIMNANEAEAVKKRARKALKKFQKKKRGSK